MNQIESSNRLLKLAAILLAASFAGFIAILVVGTVFDPFDQSWLPWICAILGYGGILIYSVSALAGVIVSVVALFHHSVIGSRKFVAAVLGTIHLIVLLSAIYMTSSPVRHKVLLYAANHNVQSAYKEVSLNYMMGRGVSKNIPEGLRWLKIAADSGDNHAMLEYSRMHGHNFWGVNPNPDIEEEYHRKAAEAGNYTARVEREARDYSDNADPPK